MSLIEYASRKIRRDTAGNWSSNNPTPLEGEWCLETDTGNVKIGDGSTAWNDLGYYIPAKLAIPYDLTSANKTHTLPPITGAPQTESVYWTGGGTYKLTLAVTDGATVGGETAGTWKGEGKGHILVESDGSNWQVREYEDSGAGWKKELDGRLLQWDKVVKNNGSTDPQTFNFPKTFYSTEIVINITQADASHSTEARVASTPTITQWACVIYSTSGSLTNGNRTVSMQATGTWK